MLLSFFLLFFLCESTVKFSTATTVMPTTTTPNVTSSTSTTVTEAKPSPLQLVATPDYPVTAGQQVILHCSGLTTSLKDMGSWQLLKNQTWQTVAIATRNLILTEPQQSGLYRCHARKQSSQNHTVYIVSVPATDLRQNLGVAAFALSLLALIVIGVILVWMCSQRPTTSNTAAKGFPAPEKSPKRGLPQTGSDGEMYINYTNNSQAYCDLDPAKVAEENVYSSLS